MSLSCSVIETNASLSLITVVAAVVVIISTVSPITSPEVAGLPKAANPEAQVALPPLNLERIVSDRKQGHSESSPDLARPHLEVPRYL